MEKLLGGAFYLAEESKGCKNCPLMATVRSNTLSEWEGHSVGCSQLRPTWGPFKNTGGVGVALVRHARVGREKLFC